MTGTPSQIVQFGKYILDEEIARGGMARVFLARLRGLGGFEKRLIIKQILPDLARDPRFVSMFVEEAKVVVQMSHPNVVPVYELGVVDGVYFLAMEHVEGATLAQILETDPLSPALAAHLGVQICDALDYAHERVGLVHRDVTPRNVIIDGSGHVRLLDFGIAAPVEGTSEHGVFGSYGYMSPEQAKGLPLKPTTDIFSLGVVLYEAVTGVPAFLRETPEASKAALLEGPAPTFDAHPEVPAELVSALMAAMNRDLAERTTSARALGRRLRAWLASAWPEGVAEELGARARAAREREARKPSVPPPSPDGHRRDPSRVVKSIATSAVLTQMLEGRTRATDEAAPAQGTAPIASERTAGSATSSETETTPRDRAAPPRETRDADRTQPKIRLDELNAPRPGARAGVPPAVPPRSRAALAVGTAILMVVALVIGVPLYKTLTGPTYQPRSPVDAGIVKPADAGETVDAPPVVPDARLVDAESHADAAEERGDAGARVVERAYLTINATPWAEVKIGARSVGVTPRRRIEAPVGRVTVELTCPPLGRSIRVPLTTVAGAETRVIVDLRTDPPSVRVH